VGYRLPPKVVLSRAVQIETGKPFPESEFSGGKGAGQANDATPELAFDLYGRYSRKAIYATQGITFWQQDQTSFKAYLPF